MGLAVMIELPGVEFRDQHFLVTPEHIAEVGGKGIEVAKLCVRDAVSGCAGALHRLGGRTIAAAPGQHQQLAALGTIDVLRWYQLRSVGHFLRAQIHHVLMIFRVVADVSGDVLFLNAAHAVRQAGCAGQGPRA